MTNCPLCNNKLPVDNTLRVDIDSGFVSRNGIAVHMSPSLLNMLDLLNSRRPRPVSAAQFMDHLYGLGSDVEEPSEHVLYVFIMKLRKAIPALGVSIRNVWGRGYLLEDVT